jgi:hypothetical protein
MLMSRLRTDRGEMNFLKVLLVLAIAGGAYVAYARGGLVVEHMDVKTAVRLGANRAYARRNPEVVNEAIVTGVRDEKEQQDYLDVAGMKAAQENFLVRGVWPGANGWERAPGDVATPPDLARFHDVVRAMAGK